MLKQDDKIEFLRTYLFDIGDGYADSFKTDIIFYFNGFEDIHHIDFSFLKGLDSKKEIHDLVDNLISKIVIKFNEDEEHLSDFIFYELSPYSGKDS